MRVFEANRDDVFFSRQLEVRHEGTFFHWVTNRALRALAAEGFVKTDERQLAWGGAVRLMWHRGNRYYKRRAAAVLELVEEYSAPNIAASLGLQGEAMVLEGFAGAEFVMRGRNAAAYAGRVWDKTEHDLDFIFERDGRAYGVEVKNTLAYMDHDELVTKMTMCAVLGLVPVFVVRMAPRTWVKEVGDAGGFVLILKHQLYPWSHRDLARRVAAELGLPVDAPRALEAGTVKRFTNWHDRQLNNPAPGTTYS